MKKLFSMAEVSRLSMTPAHRIVYALGTGRLREPRSLNGRRCFTEKDVEMVKGYFSKGNIYKERVNTPHGDVE